MIRQANGYSPDYILQRRLAIGVILCPVRKVCATGEIKACAQATSANWAVVRLKQINKLLEMTSKKSIRTGRARVTLKVPQGVYEYLLIININMITVNVKTYQTTLTPSLHTYNCCRRRRGRRNK